MNISIVKYNAGNIHSVRMALNRLNIEPEVTDHPEKLKSADKVIFPGVGEASSAMKYLAARGLDRILLNLEQPVLGICLGLQLMCKYSEENDTPCLGIFDELVKKFPPKNKVPHMGWNNLTELKGPLFENLNEGDYVYFVHSYFAEVRDDTSAKSHYILPFSAALSKDNFYAVQFHPEKSGRVGEQILKNFLKI
jgi:glutamine amidotransferase